MIYTALVSFLAGAGVALAIALLVIWARQRSVRAAAVKRKTEERLIAEAIQNLSYLANRVAGDVESHTTQVEDVNHRLTTCESGPAIVNDAVRRLLKANKQIQDRLSRSEDQLRDQAIKMESHIVASLTDPLTLLGNRLALEEEFCRCMSEFYTHGRCFSLVNVDLDNFKMLNDAHGHAAGDEVLRGLGRVFRQCVPAHAFVARLGGEEFTILLQDAPLIEACATADFAREAVSTASFPYDGNQLSITASFGVAQLHSGEDAASLFHRADQALRMAKDRGRNSVYWHDGKKLGKGLARARKLASAAGPQPQAPVVQVPEMLAAKAEASHPAADDSGVCYNLANRTMFCSSVRLRVSEWKRGGSPVSILLLKITLHDNSGPGGLGVVPARILQDVATHVRTVVRGMDMAGYYAHACFSLLIPATNPLTADDIAQRIKEQLFHLATHLGASLDLYFGTATVSDGDDAVSLLKRAESDLASHESPAEPRPT